MHEYGIASSLLESVLESARENGAVKVNSVRVRIGSLRGVVADHLMFFYEHLSKGTMAEGSSLEIEEIPLTVRCGKCGKFESSELGFGCPRCGGFEYRVEGGDMLELKSIEIET